MRSMAENRRANSLRDGTSVVLDYGTRAEAIRRIRWAIILLMSVLVVGTAGYVAFFDWGFLDALYMTVITAGTIGFEEVYDLDYSPGGRVWTMLVFFGGVGALGYATTSFVALAVEGTVRGYFRERRMRAEIDKLNDHYILCGYGRVGRQVAEEFTTDGVPFVVIDQRSETVEECLRTAPRYTRRSLGRRYPRRGRHPACEGPRRRGRLGRRQRLRGALGPQDQP